MKNRTAQLIWQTCYCTLALVAIVGSIGLYDMKFTRSFYIYFTNLSNYLAAGIMLAELIQTARKRDNGFVTVAPRLRFISMLGLVLTFLVFNLLLARDPARDPALNYKVECLLCHIVLPVMYVIDWLMFYEHGKVRWTWPVLSALYPIAYLIYVFAHAALWRFGSGVMNNAGAAPVIYPYFFLNPEKVGINGVAMWIGVLLIGFILGGFLFQLVDRLMMKRKNG
jgi:hypothetical protein